MSLFYLYYFEICVSSCFSDCLKLQLSKKIIFMSMGSCLCRSLARLLICYLLISEATWCRYLLWPVCLCLCRTTPRTDIRGGAEDQWPTMQVRDFNSVSSFFLINPFHRKKVLCGLFFLFFFLSVWNYPRSHVSVEYINWIYFLWSIFCCL